MSTEEERKARMSAYRQLQDAKEHLKQAEYDIQHTHRFIDGTTIQIGEDDCHFVITDQDAHSGQIIEAEIWYKGQTYTRLSELDELINDLWVALRQNK